jgi:hypothetical protein
MNIRPETFASVTRDIAQLRELVTSLFSLIGKQTRPRDPSIRGFCERKGISRSTYLNLRKRGEGPKETRAGVRVIITEQAEADWDRARST